MNDRFRDILDGLCRLCYCKFSFTLYYYFALYYSRRKLWKTLPAMAQSDIIKRLVLSDLHSKTPKIPFTMTETKKNKLQSGELPNFWAWTIKCLNDLRVKLLRIILQRFIGHESFSLIYLIDQSINHYSSVWLHFCSAVCRWAVTYSCWAAEEGADPCWPGEVYKEGVQWWALSINSQVITRAFIYVPPVVRELELFSSLYIYLYINNFRKFSSLLCKFAVVAVFCSYKFDASSVYLKLKTFPQFTGNWKSYTVKQPLE